LTSKCTFYPIHRKPVQVFLVCSSVISKLFRPKIVKTLRRLTGVDPTNNKKNVYWEYQTYRFDELKYSNGGKNCFKRQRNNEGLLGDSASKIGTLEKNKGKLMVH
jgi:hypothetical protein